MRLEPVMTYRCTTRGPIEVGGPQGTRQIWEVAEATLEGDGIRAALAAPGADWMGDAGDGFWRPDACSSRAAGCAARAASSTRSIA